MKQRRLGKSGLRVSPIGLGTRSWDAVMDPEEARTVVAKFLDAGGNLIDVSPSYNSGVSQQILGEALATVPREELVISVSAGVIPNAPVGQRVDCSRRTLFSELDRTLRELGTDHVDMFSVEFWDEATSPEEVIETLEQVVRSGRAHYAGLRGYQGWQLAVTQSPLIIAAQTEYNLLDRSAEQEILPAAHYLGLGFIAGATLAQGILTGKYRSGVRPTDAEVYGKLDERSLAIVEALGTAASGLGISPVSAALAWALGRPGLAAALVSVSNANQLDDVLSAHSLTLPTAIVAALDDISAL